MFASEIIGSLHQALDYNPLVTDTVRRILVLGKWMTPNCNVTMWTIEPVIATMIVHGNTVNATIARENVAQGHPGDRAPDHDHAQHLGGADQDQGEVGGPADLEASVLRTRTSTPVTSDPHKMTSNPEIKIETLNGQTHYIRRLREFMDIVGVEGNLGLIPIHPNRSHTNRLSVTLAISQPKSTTKTKPASHGRWKPNHRCRWQACNDTSEEILDPLSASIQDRGAQVQPLIMGDTTRPNQSDSVDKHHASHCYNVQGYISTLINYVEDLRKSKGESSEAKTKAKPLSSQRKTFNVEDITTRLLTYEAIVKPKYQPAKDSKGPSNKEKDSDGDKQPKR
ncbi:hypothetical protein CLAIMM_14924 [Cladophialophora immunda]|nr:hypothetical protein CLAIMM_14924 [Cladophialophora immunda]